ncbi:MAG: S1 RNA-binding domain-containing protein [Deltaproteobacteria bacterium]|nr:S1 RNA-binding domain-containing protein [Deltaproteobacteria bacterium]
MSNDDQRGDGGESEDFASMLDDYMTPRQSVAPGDKVKARIISIGKEYVFLDLGRRTEGMLDRAQVTSDGQLTVEVGQQIDVYVTAIREGTILCTSRVGASLDSEQPGDKEAALAALAQALDSQQPVEGVVKEAIKGGFSVHVLGQRAFCPISQIDRVYCEQPAEHVGRSYQFLVTQIRGNGRDVVVSRRRLLEQQAAQQAALMWDKLELDAVYDGTVTSLQKYGAFVDIGGVEGLLHVSELSYERVSDPSQVLQVGQQIRVSIKELDQRNRKIGLSLKALMEDPWLDALARLKADQVVRGRVVRIAQFGAFVELFKGVEGLLHISEMGGGQRLNSTRDAVREGQQVVVRVREIDAQRRRISLAIADEEALEQSTRPASADGLVASTSSGGGFGTFGDLFSEKLKK